MVELDLSFVSLIVLAFAVGSIAGFLLRGLRRKRIEDMLEFFRQRDKEQDRKIANLERELSDARGRLLSLKADQGKGEKASGDLRASYEEAQRTIAKLREELARPLPPPPAEPEVAVPAAAEPAAAPAPASVATPAQEPPAPEPPAAAAAPAAPAAPAAAVPAASPSSRASAKAESGRKVAQKKGRLP